METGEDVANEDIGLTHIQAEDNAFDSTDEAINVTSSSDIERNIENCTPVDDNISEYFPLSKHNSSSSIYEKVSEHQTEKMHSANVDGLVLNNSNGVCNSNCSICLVEKSSVANGDFDVVQRELILDEQVQDVPGSNFDFSSKNWSDFHTLMNTAIADYAKEEPILGRSSEGANRTESQRSFLPFPLSYYDPYSYWKNCRHDVNPTKDEGDHPGTSIMNYNHTWSENGGNFSAYTHHIRTLKSEDSPGNLEVPSYHHFPCQNTLGLSRTNDSLNNVGTYQGYALTAMPNHSYYRMPFYDYQSTSRFEPGKPNNASDFPFFYDYNQSSSFSNTVNERLLSNQAESNVAEKASIDTASEAGPSGNHFNKYTIPENNSRSLSPTAASTFLPKESTPHPLYSALKERNFTSEGSSSNSFNTSQPRISKCQQSQRSSSKLADRLIQSGSSSALISHLDLQQHNQSFTYPFQQAATTTESNEEGSVNQDMYAEYLLKSNCPVNSSLNSHRLAPVTPFPNKIMGPESKKILENWFYDHLQEPYPTRNEKEELSLKTGLSVAKISSWFCSTRKKVKDRDPTAFVMKHRGRRSHTRDYLPRQNYAEPMYNYATYPQPQNLHSHLLGLPTRLAMAFAASGQNTTNLYPNMVLQDRSDEDHPLMISDTPEPE